MTATVQIIDQPHAPWSPLLAVLLILALTAATWLACHPGLLLDAHRRGLARVRAAKHSHRRQETSP